MFKSTLLISSTFIYGALPYAGLLASSSSCQLIPQQNFSAETLVAYSFGNRVDANGAVSPGPVNRTLAETITRSSEPIVKVFAQWEIANFLPQQADITVQAIYPNGDQYLSTKGVTEQLKHKLGSDTKVWFVSHQAHACRVQMTLQSQGIEAYPISHLPSQFDGQSGQVWTRYPVLYALVDRLLRFQNSIY